MVMGSVHRVVRYRSVPEYPCELVLMVGAPPPPDRLFPNPPARSSHSVRSPVSPNPMPRSSASEIPGIPLRRQQSPLSTNPGGGLFTPEVNSAALPKVGMLGISNTWEWVLLSFIQLWLMNSTPSNYGDTTFPAINGHTSSQSRRPLPNIISAFMPSLSSSFRNNAQSTPVNPEIVQNKPPAMKRARGHTRRTLETPHTGLPHHRRDLQSIEPNGEEGAAVRRSSRLKTTGTKPVPKVGSVDLSSGLYPDLS